MSIQSDENETYNRKIPDSFVQLSIQRPTNWKIIIRQSKIVKLNKHRRTVYSRQEGILIEKPAFKPMCFRNIDLQLIRRPGKFLRYRYRLALNFKYRKAYSLLVHFKWCKLWFTVAYSEFKTEERTNQNSLKQSLNVR